MIGQQRNTKQKQLVLEVVRGRDDHPTADSVFLDARSRDGHISRATVYRDLTQLSESGEIVHVKVPGADRFDWRLEKHCHLICTCCERVIDAPATYSEQADRDLAASTGYRISRHRILFEGLCPECQKMRGDS